MLYYGHERLCDLFLQNESDEDSLKTIADSMKKSKSVSISGGGSALSLHIITPPSPPPPSQGKKLGMFRKDVGEFTGSFVESWRKAVQATKMTEVSKLVSADLCVTI